MGFVECTLPHDKVMNVFFYTMIMLKTNFKKFSGNSKEDTFKSSSTMKVVDQESITQRNSKPISREIQSQSAEKFRAIGTNIQSQLKKKRKKKKKKQKKQKKFRQYQVSAAEPQSKVATLERS